MLKSHSIYLRQWPYQLGLSLCEPARCDSTLAPVVKFGNNTVLNNWMVEAENEHGHIINLITALIDDTRNSVTESRHSEL